MISTAYKALQDTLDRETGWTPEWAQHLEVRRVEGTTVYYAHPETLSAEAVTDLHELSNQGWTVNIDSQRINRFRLQLWQ